MLLTGNAPIFLIMAKKCVSKIGGQAVLEGVMMRGERSVATAVRSSDGRIELETSRLPKTKKWWEKVFILRGLMKFFLMMVEGTKVLMRAAEVYGEDMGEPTQFEIWLAGKTRLKLMDIAIGIGLFFGILLSVGLFIALPIGIVKLLESIIPGFADINKVWINLISSFIKLLVLLGYLSVIRVMKDIRRLYMYHGAEHKVIACYEHGLELTVENARTMSKQHDRCGTSFLVITILVSVLATAFLPTFNEYGGALSYLLRFITRIALLPLIAGVAYEVLKGLAKFDNPLVRILKAPGLLFQRLTTSEPDDSMLEVALLSFATVMQMDKDENIAEVRFNIRKDYKVSFVEVKCILNSIEEAHTEAEWIFSHVLGVPRSQLALIEKLDEDSYIKVISIAEKRASSGLPLQYILGSTGFYGLDIKVDERVLIPRQDTEILVEQALKVVSGNSRVLDMCTGSGAIAIAIAVNSGAKVTAVDKSEDALAVARENASNNNCEIEFLQSDMFSKVIGEYDIIVSNPPYIPTGELVRLQAEVKKEPVMALDGGEDGLDYYRIMREKAAGHLAPGGVLLLEIGSTQKDAVISLLSGYTSVETVSDINGLDRVIRAIK